MVYHASYRDNIRAQSINHQGGRPGRCPRSIGYWHVACGADFGHPGNQLRGSEARLIGAWVSRDVSLAFWLAVRADRRPDGQIIGHIPEFRHLGPPEGSGT